MSEHPQWFQNDRNPAITDVVSINDVPVDLTAKATTFKMRAVGSSTLKVNTAVTTKDAQGVWTYGWGASDLDTAGTYLVWVTVDMGGGALETVNEDIIVVAAHAPGTNTYLELEEIKSTLEQEVGNADVDFRGALVAASRTVDDLTQTRFFTTASDEIRYYTPDAGHVLFTDEINTLTELATSSAGGTTFDAVWTLNTDFVLEPLNATVDTRPWHTVRTAGRGARSFNCYPRSVRITGKFGWSAPPEAVRVATGIIATKIVKRAKDAPMGVLTFFDGSAVRLSRFDPQVEELLAPYNRSTPFS